MHLRCSAIALAAAAALRAQEPFPPTDSLGPYGRDVQAWVALRVSPGREAYALQRIREQVPAWRAGALGSLLLTRGEGAPHRVVACGLDEPSYVVSAVTDEGYLRVHVSGARPRHALTDAMHVGQRIVVLTTDRDSPARVRIVPGVFAVRSTHLWRRVPGAADAPATLEDLWVDVGARSAREVASLGIRLLDPVFRDAPDWSMGDAVVGPAAGSRAGCAAVAAAAAAQQTPVAGTTTFVISTQSSFAWAGLRAVLARLGAVDSVFVATTDTLAPGARIRPAVELAGLPVEYVRESALRALFTDVARAAGMAGPPAPGGVRLDASLRIPQPSDSLARYAEVLARLTDTYAVSGDEAPVREVLRARMPAWARDSATVDSAGNLIVAVGPDRDTVVFVAHMDEVGFEVVRARNGVLTLRQVGGFYPTLFTGQAALLHVPSGGDRAQGCRPTSGTALRGVFLPPDSMTSRTREVNALFGAQIAGVPDPVGMRVTGFKCATRLGATRFTARSIDDRLGSAAQLLALDELRRASLDHKVIFVWAVREETGLHGARAVAATLGPTVRRVHAVDTFVSADSPLETGRFAVVRLGTGAVVRALDNSSVAPPEEIERVVRIAARARIPVQVSTTNGGNDGSVFVPYGAVDVPVSWPLRYSHSPAEVIDLRDMRSLVRLIVALAEARP